MAYKTAPEMFGDGGGFGPAVPYSTTNPPGTSAGNRGIQFGEQLTAAIANRTHYALAQNTDDLNTRLALFETSGLDAAYRGGALAVPGAGRAITKDGGAVELSSALPAMYDDDIANAHLRLDRTGDTVRGGGGIDMVGWARGSTSALYGVIDRRVLNFSGDTTVGDSFAVTLAASTVTLTGAEVLSTGGQTYLNPGFDLIEILSGPDEGVYVLATIGSPTTCTILSLNGSAPSLTAGAATARVCRPIFGSFSRIGHNGALGFEGVLATGAPATESAFDLLGSSLGRYSTAGASPDAPRYAARVLRPDGTGSADVVLSVDGHGQVRSLVSSEQQTAAQAEAALDFGVAAFVAAPAGSSPTYEAGFVAKNGGASYAWYGLSAMEASKPPTTPTGTFAFDFISILSLNVELADTTATDWNVTPLATLVEILTPTAYAGVYLVNNVGPPGTGRLSLYTLGGAAPSFPVSGAGTMRILCGTSLGNREYDVVLSLLSGWTAQGRAAAVFSGPKEVGGTALLLESGNRSASPADYFLVRGVTATAGASSEVFAVTSNGDLAADGDLDIGGAAVIGSSATATAFLYGPTTLGVRTFFPADMTSVSSAGVADFDRTISGNMEVLLPLSTDVYAVCPLKVPVGAEVQKVVAFVRSDSARAGTNGWRLQVYKRSIDWVTPGAPSVVQQGSDKYTTASSYDLFFESTTFTVAGSEDAYAVIKAPATALGINDWLIAVQVIFNDPGPRNSY